MSIRSYIFVSLMIVLGAIGVAAQGADERVPYPFSRPRDEYVPPNVRETREKMRIDKEKKEYDEMIDRSEQAAKLAERLERSYAANGRLSDMDLANLESVEKNIKKIRSDLGGDDDDEKVDEILGEKQLTVGDAVATLKDTTANLFAELKKSSRFSISAAAIQSSNAAIKITRFLRFGK
jgi:hypothetical protein